MGTRAELNAEEFAKRAQSDSDERDRVLNKASYSATSVGSRTFGWTSQVVDPPNGKIPPLTATGEARARPADRGSYGAGPFDSFEDLSLYDRCMTRGILGSSIAVIYGNGVRIAQSPDSVVISYEMLADSRVIPLDGRPHPQGNIKQFVGNGRGHWEGDTLVVETTNLTDRTSIGGNGLGVRHSDKMKLTERLRRVDKDMVEYVATVDDPVTYTKPFTVRMMCSSSPATRSSSTRATRPTAPCPAAWAASVTTRSAWPRPRRKTSPFPSACRANRSRHRCRKTHVFNVNKGDSTK